MAQERNAMAEYKQYSKDLADLKKLIKSEEYVFIDIGFYDNVTDVIKRKWTRLFSYDLPRWIYEEKKWVIRWRIAKLQCQHPRQNVDCFFTFYDKKTGFDERKKEILQKITNHFTQIRRIERALAANEESAKQLLFVTEKEEQIKRSLVAKMEWRKKELQNLINIYEESF